MRTHLIALPMVLVLGCSPAAPPSSSGDLTTGTPTVTVTAPVATETAAPTATATASASADPAAPPGAKLDVQMANDFAARSFKKAGEAPGNVFVSPPSVRLALAVAYAGAAGTTKDQMTSALTLEAATGDALTAAKAELAEWNAPRKDTELTFATRLWVEKTEPVGAPYLEQVKGAFGSGLEQVEFKAKPEPSRALVNAWVKQSTKDKIPEILPVGSVTPLTRLVITNAVYFKGQWVTPFDAKDTKPGDFTLADGKKKSVPLMHKVASYAYAEQDGMQLAGLPYQGSDLRMVVVLPPAGTPVAEAEKKLSAVSFDKFRQALSASSVRLDLALPKFELRWGGSFSGVLKSLGIVRAFTDAAEFDAIAKGLQITDVFHKTYVKVDEKGTEAAASTGVVMGVRSLPAPPKPFTVDRPFVFYIEDAKSGRVLFVGRMSDPSAK
jgi:serpin B